MIAIQILQTQKLQFSGIIDSIQIQMIDGTAVDRVFVYQIIGRAGYRPLVPQGLNDRTAKRGLPCAEFTVQQHAPRKAELIRNSASGGFRIGKTFAIEYQGYL